MRSGSWKSSSFPRIAGVQWSSTVGSTLWEVHYGAWRRAWQSSWVSSLVLRRLRRRPASPSRWHGHRYRVYRLPDVSWRRSVGHVAVPGPPGWSASACAKGVRESRGGPGPPRGGRSGPPADSAERPSLRGTWRHRTPSQAGGGSGALGVVRWSPNNRSWQNSNGSCVEHVSSRVAGSIVLPQRQGWRSSDRSWRTGLRSQPLWGMAA